ncbi:nitrous oxide-stimulated promoter [Photobacterium aquae]|uniref:Nitrous oxide-stimulated promoter n=1 Tax=Photobacterium aquae TaxID=1195763 RepID=A0A0J1GW15_9GAMM|nr:nitrous oxide-stimulated promoter family protein [Photobacterium aquae]KLV03811.1 nitrous oxide-stimulated promoter [Photobacterium aquae]
MNQELPVLFGSLATEFETIDAMVTIYCRHHHQQQSHQRLCHDCQTFLAYAHERLDRCPYGQNKPTCKQCPIHCYKPDEKALSKTIMRFSGPRMLLHHPILALRHIMAERRAIPTKPAAQASNRHQRKALEKITTQNKTGGH